MEHNQTIATGQSIPHIVGYHQGGELAAVYNAIPEPQSLGPGPQYARLKATALAPPW